MVMWMRNPTVFPLLPSTPAPAPPFPLNGRTAPPLQPLPTCLRLSPHPYSIVTPSWRIWICCSTPHSTSQKVSSLSPSAAAAAKNQSAAVATAEEEASKDAGTNVAVPAAAADVVRQFYEGINAHDLSSVEEIIAEKCVYEDLIFPRPFVGHNDIMEFFNKFIDTISRDLQLVIDDISAEDSSAVGVTWHLEWKGKPFPFSKGCSFYRLEIIEGKRQITYGRDSVEPAIKPGETALVAIRGVTWLLQRFPQLADQLR